MVLNRTLTHFAGTLLLACAIFYFSYHMLSGSKGIFTMLQLEQKLANARQSYEVVSAEREYIETRVQHMYATSLDPDLLDEQARKTLGHALPQEIIYMLETDDDAIR